jgi:hypothetical protein
MVMRPRPGGGAEALRGCWFSGPTVNPTASTGSSTSDSAGRTGRPTGLPGSGSGTTSASTISSPSASASAGGGSGAMPCAASLSSREIAAIPANTSSQGSRARSRAQALLWRQDHRGPGRLGSPLASPNLRRLGRWSCSAAAWPFGRLLLQGVGALWLSLVVPWRRGNRRRPSRVARPACTVRHSFWCATHLRSRCELVSQGRPNGPRALPERSVMQETSLAGRERRARSPSTTAADPPVDSSLDAQPTPTAPARPGPTADAYEQPPQLLTVEVLRRPIESAQY